MIFILELILETCLRFFLLKNLKTILIIFLLFRNKLNLYIDAKQFILFFFQFEGRASDTIKENAAQFCERQKIALEALKEKRKRDEVLQKFLVKQESHVACRRLELKDLLPTVQQRLTKYPLLFESLHKITVKVLPDNEDEANAILRARDSSRQILDHVNQAVKIAEDNHKLHDINKKLDKSSYDKESGNEFKVCK